MNNTDVQIHTSSYLDIKRTMLAASTLKAVKMFLAQPGGKEALDEEIMIIQEERAKTMKGAK